VVIPITQAIAGAFSSDIFIDERHGQLTTLFMRNDFPGPAQEHGRGAHRE